MRVDKARKNDTAAEIELLSASGVGKALELPPRTDRADAITADKKGTVADDGELTEPPASAGYGPLQSYELRAPGNQEVGYGGWGTVYGKRTERLIQMMLSQLRVFSVPSNSLA